MYVVIGDRCYENWSSHQAFRYEFLMLRKGTVCERRREGVEEQHMKARDNSLLFLAQRDNAPVLPRA